MRVLGVDCGSRATGFAVIDVEGRQNRVVEYGVISPPRVQTFANRLQYIHRELQDVLERHQPTCVAIEQVFQALNVKSAMQLSQVRGIVLLVAAEAQLPISEYAATSVKASVVGYGRAQKHQVQLMVQRLLQLPELPKSTDAADALAVALCHIQVQARSLPTVVG